MKREDYLERILRARVYDVAIESPLELAPALSRRLGNRLLLKREDLQSVFSFKLRGAYNKMVNLPPQKLARGVIAASAGNHAQGVALAAQKLGCRATIVMPVTTPRIKVDAVAARGARVVLHGDSYDEAYAHALQAQAQAGLELRASLRRPGRDRGSGHHRHGDPAPEHAPDRRRVRPRGRRRAHLRASPPTSSTCAPGIKVIGVEPTDADAMARSLKAGRRVKLEHVGLFADGVAVKHVGKETFRLCRRLVDEMVLVDTDEICAAIKDVFEDTRVVLEPAGALAIAGAKAWVERHGARGKKLVAVASGANTNFDRLRFVAERAEVGEHREAVLAVTIPEEPRQLPALLPRRGRAQHHRVQLPHVGSARGAHLRRRHGARPRRDAAHRAGAAPRGLSHARHVRGRSGEGPHAPHDRRALAAREGRAACTASSSPSARAR